MFKTIVKGLIFASFAVILSYGFFLSVKSTKQALYPLKYEIVGVCSTPVAVRGLTVRTSALLTDQIKLRMGLKPIPLMLDHEYKVNKIIGKVTALELGFGKTLFKAEIIANRANQAVIQMIKDGTLTDVSMGFRVTDIDLALDGRTGTANEIDLLEISLVFAGADPGAHIISIKEVE
jgi:HK97 family phage prohead protease